MGVLLIRELNVDGCGDFADVLVQTDQPVTPEQMKELHHELTRLNNEQECPDTDDVVEEAVKNTLGETARCIDYALLEYGGAGRHLGEKFFLLPSPGYRQALISFFFIHLTLPAKRGE